MSIFQFISRLIDDEDPVIIMPFGGYANSEKIYSQARVLEDEGIKHSQEDSFIKNLYNSYKRFETDESANEMVKISIEDEVVILNSDKEGYIYLDANHAIKRKNKAATEWLPITYQLIQDEKSIYTIEDQIMFPSTEASFGIISDMDDTVIDTGLSSTFKWKVIINSFFKHSSNRLPLKGAQEFYTLLQKGPDGKRDNPFFYLSNSPWNLHEYLLDFLKFYNFPRGILLLRDIGFENVKKDTFQERNKFVKISHIISTYPTLPFILIGDAADLDHDIYIEIARTFPNRVQTIYIRTVDNKNKMKAVKSIIEATTDVNVVLIETTDEAIVHAKKHQFIQ